MDIFFKLEMIANNMSIILNITNKELEHNIYSTKAINNINLLISNLVELNSNIKASLSQYPNDNLTDSLNGLASCFESIISGYELNEDNSIKDIFINRLVPRFKKFYKDLDSYIFKITGVKNAVVTGVNELSINIEKLIDLKKCRIVAFISNDNEMQEKYIKNIPIFTRNELPFVNYDYLIISDYFNCNLEKKVVININDYLKHYSDYEVFRAYYYYFNCKKPIDGFITGLSYAEVGIDVSQLSYNVINAAVSSQDLFYDYQWAKLILNNKKIANNVKFAVIGISYYSFEYDLSKSNLKNRVYGYYPFFKKTRNHPLAKDMVENYIKFEQVASEIFKKDYNIVFYDLLKGNKDTWWNDMISQVMDEKIIEKNKWIVEHDCDKDYPETVKENVGIIREYISLLKLHNITPIIVICPTSKYYYSNFSHRIKKEYENIMNKIKEEFDIEVFDYFASNVFSDKDFYNVSHLNKNGTKKFTELLNKKLIDLCDK